MFKIMAFKSKKNRSSEYQKLESVKNILFPPPTKKTDEAGNKYHIDYSLDWNLESALTDLEMGHNDKVVQNTIKTAITQLTKIREILKPEDKVDSDIQYFMIDNLRVLEDEEPIIEAAEEPL